MSNFTELEQLDDDVRLELLKLKLNRLSKQWRSALVRYYIYEAHNRAEPDIEILDSGEHVRGEDANSSVFHLVSIEEFDFEHYLLYVETGHRPVEFRFDRSNDFDKMIDTLEKLNPGLLEIAYRKVNEDIADLDY
ncbi:hypothetical protein [Yanghanlia caeni]|uniref:Uncharacterized protein n=1 Tax=Yanghanlia caeni TaxID=3064283 RepID=A0ABU1D965_9BURK|nr:hypothetical protein [Alcaligenaceae bacterium LG-2]